MAQIQQAARKEHQTPTRRASPAGRRTVRPEHPVLALQSRAGNAQIARALADGKTSPSKFAAGSRSIIQRGWLDFLRHDLEGETQPPTSQTPEPLSPTLGPGGRTMAGAYIKYSDVGGESKDANHDKWVDLE